MRSLLLVALLGLSASSLPAADFEIAIVEPEPGSAVFGLVQVEMEIYPPDAEVDRVEVYLDGLRVGLLQRQPFRILLDVGQQNVGHQIEVIAIDADGNSTSNRLHTVAVSTNIEIDVDLRQLYVNVERAGSRVIDLEEADFEVLDRSVSQELVTFEHGDVPFTAALLVDSSTSMRGRMLPTALEATRTFIRDMKPLDEAMLILFSDHVQVETPFTGSSTILGLGLGTVEAAGGTALNDAIYLALKRLERRQGRKVIVLLSDGIDVESTLSMTQVRELSRNLQPALYWIRLAQSKEGADSQRSSAWRSAPSHARELAQLRETVAETGGRIITINSIDQVGKAFSALLAELREQYVIGYYPSVTHGAGEWHEIEVQIADPAVEVRTRRGYIER